MASYCGYSGCIYIGFIEVQHTGTRTNDVSAKRDVFRLGPCLDPWLSIPAVTEKKDFHRPDKPLCRVRTAKMISHQTPNSESTIVTTTVVCLDLVVKLYEEHVYIAIYIALDVETCLCRSPDFKHGG